MKSETIRGFFWLFVPLAVGALTVAMRSGGLQSALARWTGSAPLADFPNRIELGEQELGAVVTGRFRLANLGRGELVLNDIKANCGCSGLEAEIDGQFNPVRSVTLKQSEHCDLAIRTRVRGAAGESMTDSIQFATNDPAHTTGTIQFVVSKIKGGFVTSPAQVLFGPLPLNEPASRTLDVYDGQYPPRQVDKIVAEPSERFTVRLMPLDNKDPKRRDQAKRVLVARVEVSANTTKTGPLDGMLDITMADEKRPPDRVPVIGRVLADIEVNPPSIVLPLQSISGPIYSAKCVCRSTRARPLELALVSAPPGLSVAVSSVKDKSSLRLVQIKWEPPQGQAIHSYTPQLIHLVAETDKKQTTIEIPVYINAAQTGVK